MEIYSMKEYTANNITELITAMTAITVVFENAKPWWRGQTDKNWNLLPSLYRNGFSTKEINMNVRFRNMAKTRHIKCPDDHDIFSWLFLMQHYGLPTRLLDWSESPLVALYFILESITDENDGALWALQPSWLNSHQIGKELICMKGNKDLHPLFVAAFEKVNTDSNNKTLAVLTDQIDMRHMMQQSAFTIHGDNTPINTIPQASSYLSRIIIPGRSKQAFRHLLDLFCVSRANLFPDLGNLALELSSANFSEPK